jgi:DNA adenine methylase
MKSRLTPPLKWHGGKHYLARRIVALMPPHLHYAEPYAGGLAVLLERDPNDRRTWLSGKACEAGVSEAVNDINGDLINFWRVLRSRELFSEFLRLCQATPLSPLDWEVAGEMLGTCTDPAERAWAFFVRCRQSLAGRFKGFTGLTRSRVRRGVNGNSSEWIGAVDGLPAVHTRLWPVIIRNGPAVEFIRSEDTPGTLFYCDPPYLHPTRASKDIYAFEMSESDHRELLDTVRGVKGKVMLSGYPSAQYDHALADWKRHPFNLPNHAAGGRAKRRMEEVLWCNF